MTNIGDKSVLFIDMNYLNEPAMYQCFARNEYGSNQADVFVNLFAAPNTPGKQAELVMDASVRPSTAKRPQIILGPQNTTIYEGQSVVLLCVTNDQSAGGPTASAAAAAASGPTSVTNAGAGAGNTQINWLQNDLIIEPTLMRRFEINQLLGNLRIVSVQKSDAGVYKCIASNEYGMSTAEAYVSVKSVGGSSGGIPGSSGSNSQKDLPRKAMSPSQTKSQIQQAQSTSSNPVQSSRPTVQQIGADKILLRWHLSDLRTGANLDAEPAALAGLPAVAYFKVDYKTNSRQSAGHYHHSVWLTIDEQIDAKKREYILTDLSRLEIYRFRITVFFVNGELSHSHQSARFRLDPAWSAPTQQTVDANAEQLKLSDIHVQLSQIWAISSSSLGLKWDIFSTTVNQTTDALAKHINGFYIYYRKVSYFEILYNLSHVL